MATLKSLVRIVVIGGTLSYGLLIGYFWASQEDMIFQATVVPQTHDYGFALPHEEVWFDRPDGARLHGVRFNPGGQAGNVLFFHGNGGNLAYHTSVATLMAGWGFEVLVVDYRGFGKSTGAQEEGAMLADALAIYDVRQGAILPVIVGHSLGTVFSTYVAANRPVKHLVLYAPPASLLHVMGHYYPFMPSALLRYPFRTDLYIQKVAAPIDIFHGTDDAVVPYHSGLVLKDYLKPSGQFHTVDKAGHIDVLHRPDVNEILRERLSAP